MDETWGPPQMTKVEVAVDGADVVAVTGLFTFGGQPGFSLCQGRRTRRAGTTGEVCT